MTDEQKEQKRKQLTELNASLTPEERKARASAAGKASGAARKERASFREALNVELSKAGKMGRMARAMINAAIDGNVNAWLAVRDTVGEKPVDKQEITQNEIIVTIEE